MIGTSNMSSSVATHDSKDTRHVGIGCLATTGACIHCAWAVRLPGRTTLGQCVDHVVPHQGDPLLMWEIRNLQSLCHWHHNVIKQQLEQLHAQGLIEDCDLRMDSPKAIALTKQRNVAI